MTGYLQRLIHLMEVGGGARFLRWLLGSLAVVFVLVVYDWRCYRNFSTQEAMDQAQIGRNLAEGRGYTTEFIRPFSMFLIKRFNQGHLDKLDAVTRGDLCEVKSRPHPDISNPPVYPVVLAGLTKVLPANREAMKERPFWWASGRFARYQPDFQIAVFNQLLLLALAVITFFLARRLFDSQVAWLSAILVLGTDMLWKFSVSGLSTMLLLVLFMTLIWALVRWEAATREETPRAMKIFALALAVGVLLGTGMLTRYAYGFVLFPVLFFAIAFGGKWRLSTSLIIVGVFALVVTPWVMRNLSVCGTPFGTAGYAAVENSAYFPGHRLERSLNPDFSQVGLTPLWWKFFANLRTIIIGELPILGGSWAAAFFLVGLLFGFRNPALSRLRWFTLALLGTLLVVQAVGKTALTDDSPGVNSENLLILLLPLVLIYGVGFFNVLLDQVELPFSWMRYVVMGGVAALASVPFLFNFLPPKTSPVAFPPYHPPSIQQVCDWMRPGELIMSDVPWALAWYGDRQSILLTLDAQGDFYEVNDFVKPVSALYLTPLSLDAKFLSQWARGGGEATWGELVIGSLTHDALPPRFPLRKSVRLTDQIFLADWERWLKTDDTAKPAP
jgi:hypothetical protein